MTCISQESSKLYWKIAKKTKNTPLMVKKWNFQQQQQKKEYAVSNGTRFSHLKYHISRGKIVTCSLKPKIYITKNIEKRH